MFAIQQELEHADKLSTPYGWKIYSSDVQKPSALLSVCKESREAYLSEYKGVQFRDALLAKSWGETKVLIVYFSAARDTLHIEHVDEQGNLFESGMELFGKLARWVNCRTVSIDIWTAAYALMWCGWGSILSLSEIVLIFNNGCRSGSRNLIKEWSASEDEHWQRVYSDTVTGAAWNKLQENLNDQLKFSYGRFEKGIR